MAEEKKEEKKEKKELATKDRLVVEVVKGAPQFLTTTQVERISIPTPKQFIKQREGKGGKVFDYIDTSYIISTLNGLFGFMWEFDVIQESTVEEAMKFESVRVKGKLTVKDSKGNSISKTNYGSQPMIFKKNTKHEPINLSTEFGDLYKGASSDCLKKCSSLFGIALDVYSGETNLERISDEKKDNKEKEELESSDGKWHISEQQRKFLFALCKKAKMSNERLHENIKADFEKEHLSELTREEFDYIIRSVGGENIKAEEIPKDKEGEQGKSSSDSFSGLS